MSDTLKDAALAVFGLALVSGLLGQRAEHAISHDLSKTAMGGTIHTTLVSRGPFGNLFGQASFARITGEGLSVDNLPFRITHGGGLRANVGKMELDFRNIVVKGIPFQHFTATIPQVFVDSDALISREHLVIRSAQEGIAEATIGVDAINLLSTHKLAMISDRRIDITDSGVTIQGMTTFLGMPTLLELTGKLETVDGKRVNLVLSRLQANGLQIDGLFAQELINAFNPVLDVERDLGLQKHLTITNISTNSGKIVVRAKIYIPDRRDDER